MPDRLNSAPVMRNFFGDEMKREQFCRFSRWEEDSVNIQQDAIVYVNKHWPITIVSHQLNPDRYA